jgi:hypothetical protein
MEGTLIYLNLSLSCVHPLPSSLTLDLFDQLRLDCLYLYINTPFKSFPSTRLVLG